MMVWHVSDDISMLVFLRKGVDKPDVDKSRSLLTNLEISCHAASYNQVRQAAYLRQEYFYLQRQNTLDAQLRLHG